MNLYPFQHDGVSFLRGHKIALLADEPGLGKTAQAIMAANFLCAQKVLVVCPAGLKLNWKKEIDMWAFWSWKVQILTTSKDKIDDDAHVVVVNYDLITHGMEYAKGTKTILGGKIYDQIMFRRWDVGIFDESHYMKSHVAVRTKAILQRNRIASRCTYKWYLTGTPILNRPIELYPLLKANCPELIAPYDTYEGFANQFCDAWWDGPVLNAKGHSNEADLNKRLKNFMLRRLKKNVLKDLPAKTYQLVPLAQTDQTKPLVSKELSWGKEIGFSNLSLGGEHIATHRKNMALARLNQCIEYIVELLESVDKLVIFAHHVEVIQKLQKGLENYNAMAIHGATTQAMRQNIVNAFQQKPDMRVFIGQLQAAGTGITLTAASTVVFVESSWVPGEIQQAIDRCHRIGQKDAVLAQFLYVEGSIEENILSTAVDKLKTIEQIVDGVGLEDPFELFTDTKQE